MKLLTIYIYEAVYHFQLLLQSDVLGGQSAVSAGRPDNLKITSVKLSTVIVGGGVYRMCSLVKLTFHDICIWYIYILHTSKLICITICL